MKLDIWNRFGTKEFASLTKVVQRLLVFHATRAVQPSGTGVSCTQPLEVLSADNVAKKYHDLC
jgi:hypothetical protein